MRTDNGFVKPAPVVFNDQNGLAYPRQVVISRVEKARRRPQEHKLPVCMLHARHLGIFMLTIRYYHYHRLLNVIYNFSFVKNKRQYPIQSCLSRLQSSPNWTLSSYLSHLIVEHALATFTTSLVLKYPNRSLYHSVPVLWNSLALDPLNNLSVLEKDQNSSFHGHFLTSHANVLELIPVNP